uniref:Secreted protein n=1 Tax=Ascaris lumbricoides TaxID=6252 RepID=A0A0M3HX77_ASCLU
MTIPGTLPFLFSLQYILHPPPMSAAFASVHMVSWTHATSVRRNLKVSAGFLLCPVIVPTFRISRRTLAPFFNPPRLMLDSPLSGFASLGQTRCALPPGEIALDAKGKCSGRRVTPSDTEDQNRHRHGSWWKLVFRSTLFSERNGHEVAVKGNINKASVFGLISQTSDMSQERHYGRLPVQMFWEHFQSRHFIQLPQTAHKDFCKLVSLNLVLLNDAEAQVPE